MTSTTSPSPIVMSQAELDNLVSQVLPLQGQWSPEAYLWLTDHTNRLIEFTDGCVEVLPLPTDERQMISRRLFLAVLAFRGPRGGLVLYAPCDCGCARASTASPICSPSALRASHDGRTATDSVPISC